jgi:hypothetical protein
MTDGPYLPRSRLARETLQSQEGAVAGHTATPCNVLVSCL